MCEERKKERERSDIKYYKEKEEIKLANSTQLLFFLLLLLLKQQILLIIKATINKFRSYCE